MSDKLQKKCFARVTVNIHFVFTDSDFNVTTSQNLTEKVTNEVSEHTSHANLPARDRKKDQNKDCQERRGIQFFAGSVSFRLVLFRHIYLKS
jgi:hypothetical protein